ncbi:hypothetical protein BKA70DRAFT_1440144 [Coprinopsis sp. MPI-PUGE-AT-0042]|nr:hypothetical protein BKA70DRAFT_1440144 [Coprinopsis sp. MPI-PUGE-AT-0042]
MSEKRAPSPLPTSLSIESLTRLFLDANAEIFVEYPIQLPTTQAFPSDVHSQGSSSSSSGYPLHLPLHPLSSVAGGSSPSNLSTSPTAGIGTVTPTSATQLSAASSVLSGFNLKGTDVDKPRQYHPQDDSSYWNESSQPPTPYTDEFHPSKVQINFEQASDDGHAHRDSAIASSMGNPSLELSRPEFNDTVSPVAPSSITNTIEVAAVLAAVLVIALLMHLYSLINAHMRILRDIKKGASLKVTVKGQCSMHILSSYEIDVYPTAAHASFAYRLMLRITLNAWIEAGKRELKNIASRKATTQAHLVNPAPSHQRRVWVCVLIADVINTNLSILSTGGFWGHLSTKVSIGFKNMTKQKSSASLITQPPPTPRGTSPQAQHRPEVAQAGPSVAHRRHLFSLGHRGEPQRYPMTCEGCNTTYWVNNIKTNTSGLMYKLSNPLGSPPKSDCQLYKRQLTQSVSARTPHRTSMFPTPLPTVVDAITIAAGP